MVVFMTLPWQTKNITAIKYIKYFLFVFYC